MVTTKEGTYFYAVRYGQIPGIYNTWAECEAQVKGHSRSVFKKFTSEKEAKDFIGDTSIDEISDDFKKIALDEKYPVIEENAVVYTDGSCLNNGAPSAAAGYGVYWGRDHIRNTSETLKGTKQTNQRAKISAVNHALEQSQDDTGILEIVTYDYVIKAINVWSKKWVVNGWKAANGSEVLNKDLFELTLSLIQSRKGKVELIYGSGKNHIEGTKEAGRLAVDGARKQKDALV